MESKKCVKCHKKSSLQCKCGEYTCIYHRYAEMHACTFDYKEHHILKLKKQLPKIIAPKLTKI